MLALIDFGDLLRVVLAATVSGVGVTAAFSLALLGTIHTAEARRAGRSSVGWSAVAVLAGAATLAAAIAGVYAVAAG